MLNQIKNTNSQKTVLIRRCSTAPALPKQMVGSSKSLQIIQQAKKQLENQIFLDSQANKTIKKLGALPTVNRNTEQTPNQAELTKTPQRTLLSQENLNMGQKNIFMIKKLKSTENKLFCDENLEKNIQQRLTLRVKNTGKILDCFENLQKTFKTPSSDPSLQARKISNQYQIENCVQQQKQVNQNQIIFNLTNLKTNQNCDQELFCDEPLDCIIEKSPNIKINRITSSKINILQQQIEIGEKDENKEKLIKSKKEQNYQDKKLKSNFDCQINQIQNQNQYQNQNQNQNQIVKQQSGSLYNFAENLQQNKILSKKNLELKLKINNKGTSSSSENQELKTSSNNSSNPESPNTNLKKEKFLNRVLEKNQVKEIQLVDDQSLFQNVKIGDFLGSGAYGKVYKCMNSKTGQFMAVKQIKLSKEEGGTQLKQYQDLLKEITLLRELQHPNIVQYIGCAQNEQELYIYMQEMTGGSILQMLNQYGNLPEQVIRKFVIQLLDGLEFLHSQGVIHRDIKGANILTDGKGNVKLSDFGAAKYIKKIPQLSLLSTSSVEQCKSIKGSYYWMAPELIKQEGHGRRIDIWSLGCLIIEMATGKHPWPDCKHIHDLIFQLMSKQCPPIPEHLSEDAKDFIQKCCTFDPKNRPRPSVLRTHAFIVGNNPQVQSEKVVQNLNNNQNQKNQVQTPFITGNLINLNLQQQNSIQIN